ncbi:MAG: DUF1176 domain-containing protein [Sphingobium sp.]
MLFPSFVRVIQGPATVVATGVILLSHAAQAAPKSGPMETFRDWVIGCDNVRTCTAASLIPEGDTLFDRAVTVYLRREGDARATPSILLRFADEAATSVDLWVDGTTIATAPAKDGTATIAAEKTAMVMRALARGSRLEIRAGHKVIGTASLTGSSAALRFMDVQQGRAGTVTAMVAKGELWATAVKTPPRLPVVRYLAPPQGDSTSATLWREERTRALALSGCAAEQTPGSEASIYPLSKSQQLVLIPCGAGAYNFNSVPLIATGNPGRRSFTLPRFDSRPGWGGEAEAPPMLVNASWDTKTGQLMSYAKGRGLGDCGSSQSYVWDGSTFRLIEMRMMNQCRGAWDWIPLWRARPVEMMK